MNTTFEPNFAVPPGETLAETLETLGMTQAELAERMGRPLKTINEILAGKAAITSDTALQLEKVLGVPASFWTNHERIYRDTLARHRETDELEQQLGWLKTMPVKEMVRAGWIVAAAEPVAQLRIVLSFFGVAGVDEWRALWESPDAIFRKSPAFAANRPATAAWLRQGELEAQKINSAPFDEIRFAEVLAQLRGFTVKDPEEFVPALHDQCSGAGVAVVIVPPLPGVRAYGATRWLHSTKALIQLSLRGKTDDHLWFTFFHEAGHVLKHGKRAVFVEDGDPKAAARDSREAEADAFACDLLIPAAEYERFCANADFSVAAMRKFANRLGIAPGIVAGRLQHESKVPFSRANQLKRRFDFGD
ncbi:MAG: HigA family addiction module antidote protein [Verrucomicrobia bacterium]|nr:HigA family addiction module antidote protein [Verrucomicrobiota bacterium]